VDCLPRSKPNLKEGMVQIFFQMATFYVLKKFRFLAEIRPLCQSAYTTYEPLLTVKKIYKTIYVVNT